MAQLFVERFDPARVLAEVHAKRRIMDEHTTRFGDDESAYGQECLVDGSTWPCVTMRLLALPYASYEGYRDEWSAAVEPTS